jgi:hypothetical protein
MQCLESVQSFSPCLEAPIPAIAKFSRRIDGRVGALLSIAKQGRERLWQPRTSSRGLKRPQLLTSHNKKEQGAILRRFSLLTALCNFCLTARTFGVSENLLSAASNVDSNSKQVLNVIWSNAQIVIHRGVLRYPILICEALQMTRLRISRCSCAFYHLNISYNVPDSGFAT